MSRQVTCTHSKQGRARGQRARAANKGKDVAHRLVAGAWLAEEHYAHVAEDGHEEFGLVFEQRRGIDLHGPAQAHAGQGRVCRPVAAVCSSAPQYLEPLPPPRIVKVAPQDHHVHLLAATRHGCARSKQKHESAQAQCVSPLCAVASCSTARAICLFNLGHQMRPSPMVGNGVNKRTVASCETCFDEATRA